MNPVSLCDHSLSLAASQSMEQNDPLKKDSKGVVESISPAPIEQPLESKSSKNITKAQQSTQETCKMEQLSRKVLFQKPLAEAETQEAARKRAREEELEGAPPAKIFKPDLWVEHESANLLVNIFEEEMSFTSSDQLPKAICERVEQIISAFEKQAQEKSSIGYSQIEAVKNRVQERLKREIESLNQVDPVVFEKLHSSIKTIHEALSLSSSPKGFEESDPLINGGYIYFLNDASTQGFDVRPFVKRILEFPPNFHKQLLELLGAICAPYSSDFFITALFNEISCFLKKETEFGPTENILKFAQELVDIKKKRNEERDLVFEECYTIAPFFRKSHIPKANLNCLKQVIAEVSSGRLPFLQNEETVWSPLLSRLSYLCACGIPISSQLINLYANQLHELQTGLKQKFALSKKEERKIFDGLAALSLDPQKGLQILESVDKQDKERLKSLLQEDCRAVMEFLTQGGTPVLYTELKRHGALKNQFSFTVIHWTKEMVASLKSFSRSNWERLKYLIHKDENTPFHELVSQIK